jgi:hypothetical protein
VVYVPGKHLVQFTFPVPLENKPAGHIEQVENPELDDI